jgi:ABC-2 type transport system ATP-binding protein
LAAVEVIGASKAYRKVEALKSCDFSVAQGTVMGLLGPNGTGKTTLLRIIAGLSRPDSGLSRVFGVPAGTRALVGRVGVTIEGPAFYPWLSGAQNLSVLASSRRSAVSYAEVDRALRRLGLEGARDSKVGAYSQGMRQRLAIALAVVRGPDLLVLDEPGNGLDPEGMADPRKLILEERGRGATVIVSSHQLHEVEQVCDSVTVINQGRLVASRTGDERSARGRVQSSGSGLEEFYLDAIRESRN